MGVSNLTWYLAGGTLVNAYEPSPFVSSVAIPEFPPVEVSSVTFAPAMAGVRTESARVTLPEMPPGVAAMLRLTVVGVPFDAKVMSEASSFWAVVEASLT